MEQDEAVARLLWTSVEELVAVPGGRWRRVSAEDSDEEWFVTGEPAQLALGSIGPGRSSIVLARPGIRWLGHQPEWTFEDRRTVDPADLHRDPDGLRAIADDVAAKRRRTFRWCGT